MSLPKKNRLKQQCLFKQLKKIGKTIKTPLFNILYLSQEEIEAPKIGFVVSKRIDKSAVVRNQIKRKLAVAVGNLINKLQPNILLLFLVKHPVKIASIKEIEKTILSCKDLF